MQATEILSEIKPRLEAAFGQRLRGVILYGSRARGDTAPDSDMDLLVLLDSPITLVPDISTIVHALYPLQLEVDFPIHGTPASMDSYQAQVFPLYRNVKREGIEL